MWEGKFMVWFRKQMKPKVRDYCVYYDYECEIHSSPFNDMRVIVLPPGYMHEITGFIYSQ